MKLQHDVTFDSLSAVRQELREWFGPESTEGRNGSRSRSATRDMLLSVIIQSLAEELSDASVRARIQEALEKLPSPSARQTR